jgi:hypothetical protein
LLQQLHQLKTIISKMQLKNQQNTNLLLGSPKNKIANLHALYISDKDATKEDLSITKFCQRRGALHICE